MQTIEMLGGKSARFLRRKQQQIQTSNAKRGGNILTRPFIPSEISGVSLWLDADDSSTLTGTATITQWNDKSGNTGRNATAVGEVTRIPWQGRFALNFNGSSYLDGLMTNGTNSLTSFAVFSAVSRNATAVRILSCAKEGEDVDTIGEVPAFLLMSNEIRLFRNNQFLSTGITFPTSTPNLLVTQYSGTAPLKRLNGASSIMGSSASGVFDYSGYRIGGGMGHPATTTGVMLIGQIAEVISFSSALTEAQIQQVEGYLAHKWGLQGSLLPGHPFKNAAPTI